MVGLAQNQLVLVIVSSLLIVCALFFFIHTFLGANSIEVQNLSAKNLSTKDLSANARYNDFWPTNLVVTKKR